jgi:hypothetical protein
MKQDPDERAHLIKEYRINAARMRAQANAARKPEQRIALPYAKEMREALERWADHVEAITK